MTHIFGLNPNNPKVHLGSYLLVCCIRFGPWSSQNFMLKLILRFNTLMKFKFETNMPKKSLKLPLGVDKFQ